MTNYTPRRWQIRAMLDGTLSTLVVPLPKVPRFSPEFERQWHCNAIPHSGGKPGEWGWWNGPWHGQSLYHTQTLPLTLGKPVWVREAWNVFQCSRDGDMSWPFTTIPKEDPRDDPDARSLIVVDHPVCSPCAPGHDAGKGPWRSPATMPRWASRLTLVASEARVCRVQDVTEEEARAAGVEQDPETGAWWGAAGRGLAGCTRRYVPATLALADLLSTGRDHGAALQDRNPWVQIARVAVHHCNIDKLKAEEDAA